MWSRQAPTSAPVIASSIDYSSVAVPPTSRPSVASNPAIVIPFLPSSTITSSPSSTFFSTSTLSSLSSSQKITTITQSYSLSSTASPTSSAQNSTLQSSIKLIYLIPGFALAGILLGGLIGWLIYRRMTRKPLIPRDDGALLIGPRYIGLQEPERDHIQGQNIERRGQFRSTQMKNHLPRAIHARPHFRWPSFNEKPAFHPERGFHVPDEYLHDDDPLLVLPLTTPPSTNINTRTKSTRTTRTSKSARTVKSTKRPTLRVVGSSLSSPNSDNTSLALLELYESDEEEETRRKAHEVPWESLRHKSIKRGMLEQIKEEDKRLDSIRGLAGSSFLGPRPETIMEEDNALLGGRDADDSMGVEDGSNALYKLTRLPTSLAEGRKKSNRSNSPVKRTSNNGVDISQVPRRDVLPQSPAQLMSPPLQSQIFFTPIPASSSRLECQNPREHYSNSRVLSPTKPLVVSNVSKSSRKPHNLQRLPKFSTSANTQGDTMLEDPMKKVERIMASSWSARDLGQGGIRNLSPTGFGRHP